MRLFCILETNECHTSSSPNNFRNPCLTLFLMYVYMTPYTVKAAGQCEVISFSSVEDVQVITIRGSECIYMYKII